MVEAQKVMLKFGELVTNVKLALKSRGVTVEVFASHLMTIKGLEPVYDQSQTPLLEACIEKVRIQQSVCDAVDAISDFFSWFNHMLIVNIIETFCKHNKDIKERQRDFRQHFQQYCNHRICKFARNGFGFPRKEDAAVLIVEVDTKWDTARVDQIAFIRDTISNILHVKRQALYLRTVDNVRRRLEFLVPQYIANAIVPLAVNPREQAAALSRAGVQEIHCCNVHCYFYPTTGIPTSTQTMTSKAIEEERLIHTTWYSRNTSSDLSEGRREKTTSLDKIQELRGNIRVFCRCRYDSSGPCALLFDGEGKLSCVTDQGRRKVFEFEKVYTPDTTQGEVFEDTKPIITSCVDGYSICIIAYGQTGAGKTYTMMGPIKKPGVNIRSMKELFKICSERTMVKYTMKVSIVEVYNESVYDLLIPPSEGHAKLQLHKRGKEVIVPGLTEEEVASIDDVITVMREGENNRTVASTKMNTNSSRSHLLFLLKVEGYDTVSGATSHGRLTLVDLAGSERISRSEATGTRLAEAAAINKSLSALGQVFVAIHNGAHHIPYRNSKLTHLLQPCLGGESKACTCMFVNISPLEANIPETVSTLEFGQNARQVELGKATKHVTKPTNVLSQYQ